MKMLYERQSLSIKIYINMSLLSWLSQKITGVVINVGGWTKESVKMVHYDPELPLKLDCDASSVGIGAVLSRVMKVGTESPIA